MAAFESDLVFGSSRLKGGGLREAQGGAWKERG